MKIEYDDFRKALPSKHRHWLSEELVDKINDMAEDPQLMETFRDNLFGCMDVLSNSRNNVTEYVNAVKYISLRLMGNKDLDAYSIVFPDRYKKLEEKGLSRSEMGSYVAAYNKSKIVVKLMEQTLIPSYIVNAPLHQKAINELVNIGLNGRSEMARVNALSKVAELTKMPEENRIKLDIGIDNGDAINELRKATQELAKQQKLAIESGANTTKEIAHSNIITVETKNE
jgi:hypothetical protein